MGLLDPSPDDLVELFRNAMRNGHLIGGSGADDADFASPRSVQQARWQQAPLSLAGPGFTADAAASPDQARAAVPLPRSRPAEAPARMDAPWPTKPAIPLAPMPQGRQSADLPNWARPPGPAASNLTVDTLRQRGVPEAYIAAAIDNPQWMQRLLQQTYRPESAAAPAAAEDLWSGRTPAAPLVLPPQTDGDAPDQLQAHGKSDRLPAGLPGWARRPTGNPFVAYQGAVRGVPAITRESVIAEALRRRNVPDAEIAEAMDHPERLEQLLGQDVPGTAANRPGRASTPPRDKYQQAAFDEIARLRRAGVPLEDGYTRMLTHGYFLPLDSGSRLASALTAPIEAYRHGTGVLEGYRYAKAREDQLLDEARRNTGGLGTGAEILGGIARGLKPAWIHPVGGAVTSAIDSLVRGRSPGGS